MRGAWSLELPTNFRQRNKIQCKILLHQASHIIRQSNCIYLKRLRCGCQIKYKFDSAINILKILFKNKLCESFIQLSLSFLNLM